jgi:3-dehydroquinate synthase
MFYQPKLVLCDTNTLDTLPKRVFNDGMAEVIKHAFIKDKELYNNLLMKDFVKNNIQDVVYKNCEIKSQVVLSDEFDTGNRMILNLDTQSGTQLKNIIIIEKYTHGEAVATGMAAISKIGEFLGITPSYCTMQS